MLNSTPLVYIAIFMPVTYCFDEYSFVVSFETLFFFKIILAISCLLQFRVNFVISLSAFGKKGIDRYCIESVGQFGGYCCRNNIMSDSPWMQDVFPFIYIFFNFS